jgi:hypothetical protein
VDKGHDTHERSNGKGIVGSEKCQVDKGHDTHERSNGKGIVGSEKFFFVGCDEGTFQKRDLYIRVFFFTYVT